MRWNELRWLGVVHESSCFHSDCWCIVWYRNPNNKINFMTHEKTSTKHQENCKMGKYKHEDTLAPETYAVNTQLQCRARVNSFLTQLQLVNWVDFFYAATVFPLCRIDFSRLTVFPLCVICPRRGRHLNGPEHLFRRLSALHWVEGHSDPFSLRELECFRLELVMNHTLSWKEARLVTCFVGLCAMGDV